MNCLMIKFWSIHALSTARTVFYGSCQELQRFDLGALHTIPQKLEVQLLDEIWGTIACETKWTKLWQFNWLWLVHHFSSFTSFSRSELLMFDIPLRPCNRPHHSGPGYDCRGRMVHWAGACAGALGNKWKQARCDKLCIPGSCIRLHLLLQLIWVRFRTGFPCRCEHDKKAWIIEATMQATNHTSITWRVFWDASLSTGLLPWHGI